MICTVTGTITNADGTPNPEVQIVAMVESRQVDQGGQVVGGVGITSDPIEVFTEDDGTFALNLVQGSRVLLEIPSINLRKTILVPAMTTVDFADLI